VCPRSRGHAAGHALAERAFSDLHYEIHQVIAQGDTVAIFCT